MEEIILDDAGSYPLPERVSVAQVIKDFRESF